MADERETINISNLTAKPIADGDVLVVENSTDTYKTTAQEVASYMGDKLEMPGVVRTVNNIFPNATQNVTVDGSNIPLSKLTPTSPTLSEAIAGKVSEAPSDGNVYVRKDDNWNNLTPQLETINTRLNSVEGRGGYLAPYNFLTATPTEEQLNDYALTQISDIYFPSEIFNGTRVKNLYDNHLFILTNTPHTNPAVFEWIDNGYDTVGIATNSVAGVVKGSASNGGLTIAADGTASVNGFNAKIDATKINGVAIAGKNNTCEDLGLQGKLTEGSGIQIDEVVTAPVKFLMSTKNDVNFPVEDISGAPLGFLQMNPTKYVLGPELYANSTIKSIGSRYDQYGPAYISKGSFDWSKLNIGTGPFTVTFRRLLTKDNINPTDNYIIYSDQRGSTYNYGIRSDGSFWCDYWNATAGIPIIKNVIEEIKLTRLEDGTYEWYKNGTKLGTDQNILKGLTVDFSFGKMLRLGDMSSSYQTVGFFVSGLTITNTPYTGGNYTLSEDYPTTGVIVTTNTISAVAGTIAFDNTNTGISATNIQDAIEEVDAKRENLPTGNVEILTATGGVVNLLPGNSYYMEADSNVTFSLATPTNITNTNKVEVFLKRAADTVAVGTDNTVAKIMDVNSPSLFGHYVFYFTNSIGKWVGECVYWALTERIVPDMSAEIPAGYSVSEVIGNGASMWTASNNTEEIVAPLQDTPYSSTYPRNQVSMTSDIRYKIKLPMAKKFNKYSVQAWAENGSYTDRILKSWKVYTATSDVDITVDSWRDNCILVDTQVDQFDYSSHNTTKYYTIATSSDVVSLILEPTANCGSSYVCLGQLRFYYEG